MGERQARLAGAPQAYANALAAKVRALRDRLRDQIGAVTGRLDAIDTERRQLLTQ